MQIDTPFSLAGEGVSRRLTDEGSRSVRKRIQRLIGEGDRPLIRPASRATFSRKGRRMHRL